MTFFRAMAALHYEFYEMGLRPHSSTMPGEKKSLAAIASPRRFGHSCPACRSVLSRRNRDFMAMNFLAG